jgi:hypothetical protein
MSDVASLLRSGDPLRSESGMDASAAAEMRRAVVAAADPRPLDVWWLRPYPLAAAVAASLAIGVATGVLWERPARVTAPAARPVQTAESTDRRQLHFATPGGTRIIWTFNRDVEF